MTVQWPSIAELAVLVRERKAGVYRTLSGTLDVRGPWTPRRLNIPSEQSCEYLFAAFGELAREGGPAPEYARAREAEARLRLPCPTCGAQNGSWCSPVHAGEREPGNWVHPMREKWDEHLNLMSSEHSGFNPARDEFRPDPRGLEIASQIVDRHGSVAHAMRGSGRAYDELLRLAGGFIALERLARHELVHPTRPVRERFRFPVSWSW